MAKLPCLSLNKKPFPNGVPKFRKNCKTKLHLLKRKKGPVSRVNFKIFLYFHDGECNFACTPFLAPNYTLLKIGVICTIFSLHVTQCLDSFRRTSVCMITNIYIYIYIYICIYIYIIICYLTPLNRT